MFAAVYGTHLIFFSGNFNVARNMVHLKMAKENVDYKKLQTDLEQQELEVICNYQGLF